jgi:predicted dehydrogenase
MSYNARNPARIAIVGVGSIGPRHAEAVFKDPHTEVACIVDPNPAAKLVAERFECPVFESLEQMFSQSTQVDGAIVCTPNHTHVAVSKALLKGGVHVLCEKPISVNISSGKELVGVDSHPIT